MDTRARMNLKARAVEKLREILENGDQTYLLSLSRPALRTALERELYFLGLYSAEDTEARACIYALIEEHADMLFLDLHDREQRAQALDELVAQAQELDMGY